MQKIILISLLCLCCITLFANTDSLVFLTYKDTVALRVENNEKTYTHTVKKGQTLFSLAKFFGLHYQELQYFNPGLREEISIGQAIRIPIPNRAILRYLPKGSKRTGYAPVVYLVKKGDTVFRISQYFKMPVDTVIARGKIKANVVKPGVAIPVGWMSTQGIPESARSAPAHPMLKKNLPLKERFLYNTDKKKIHSDQGPAFWQKNAPSEGDAFYAMFNGAPVRSVIEIYNPMNQGKIYAEVLGAIPPTVYEKNIKVVLSPAAAKMLGARDPQFFVKVRYYK